MDGEDTEDVYLLPPLICEFNIFGDNNRNKKITVTRLLSYKMTILETRTENATNVRNYQTGTCKLYCHFSCLSWSLRKVDKGGN